jgi:hypothetical protein
MNNYDLLLKNLLDIVDKHEFTLTEDDILNLLKIRHRWPFNRCLPHSKGEALNNSVPPVITISQWRQNYWGTYYDASGIFLYDQWKKAYDLGFTTILSDILDLTEELRDLDQKMFAFSGAPINANFYFSKGSENHRISFDEHMHDYDVIVKMIYGKCLWKIGGEFVEMENNTVLIPSHTPHCVIESKSKKLSLTINLH